MSSPTPSAPPIRRTPRSTSSRASAPRRGRRATSTCSSRRASRAARPRGDAPRRRLDPERVLLRRVRGHPGLPRQGDPGREQAPEPRPRARRARQRAGPDRRRAGGRPRQRAVRVHGRARRGVPQPRRAALDAARTRTATAACPRRSVEPDVWRGEINVGDQLLLVSPTVVGALGADALKDALVTLHPQSAVETLTTRFRAGGGTGSDGALVIEAAEIAVSRAGVVPVPGAAGRAARRRRRTARRSRWRTPWSAASPPRSPARAGRAARPAAPLYRGPGARSRTRCRAAASATGGSRRSAPAARCSAAPRWPCCRWSSSSAASAPRCSCSAASRPTGPGDRNAATPRRALLERARTNLNRVIGPGIDLVVSDPDARRGAPDRGVHRARARRSGRASRRRRSTPSGRKVVAALDRLYGMVDVASSPIFTFPDEPAIDLRRDRQGPRRRPVRARCRDRRRVYRIDLAGQEGDGHLPRGQQGRRRDAGGAEARWPSAGRDLLMVDARNVVWRWRPANTLGQGHDHAGPRRRRVRVGRRRPRRSARSSAIPEANLYNFYVVDPSAQQILRYSPAADGGGFPNSAERSGSPRRAT